MKRLIKALLAILTAGAVLLIGGSAHALGVVGPTETTTGFEVFGFVTVAPGILLQDAPDSDQSGDPDPSLENSLSAEIYFSFGTETLKIIGAQFFRDDPVICNPTGVVGSSNTNEGISCDKQMLYLDWDITDAVHLYVGRLDDAAGSYTHRTIIWETYMGWTPVLPTGGYFLMWEGNDMIDVTWNLSPDIQIGLNLRDGGAISALGANDARDVRPSGGNIGAGGQPCSGAAGAGGCSQSTTIGPTFMLTFGKQRLSGGLFVELQNKEEDPSDPTSEGFDDSEDLTHNAFLVIYRNDYGDAGGMFGIQYTLLNIDGGDTGVDTTVNDIAAQLIVEIADGQVVFGNIDVVNWDFDGPTQDDLYFDFGWIDNDFGPGQRVGVAFRQLSIVAVDNNDDSSVGVLELSFWQNF